MAKLERRAIPLTTTMLLADGQGDEEWRGQGAGRVGEWLYMYRYRELAPRLVGTVVAASWPGIVIWGRVAEGPFILRFNRLGLKCMT
jgi:hypothetical protein